MRHHLRRLGDQADQLLDRRLAGDVEHRVDRPPAAARTRSATPRRRAPGSLRSPAGSPGWPRRRRRSPCASGERHLHRDRPHAARAAVDEQRVAGLRRRAAEGPLARSRRPRRPRRPPPSRWTAACPPRSPAPRTRPGCCRPPEDVVADATRRHALADLVDDPGGVVPEVTRAVDRLAAGHAPGEDLPVDRVHARRADRDPDLPGPACGPGPPPTGEPRVPYAVNCSARIPLIPPARARPAPVPAVVVTLVVLGRSCPGRPAAETRAGRRRRASTGRRRRARLHGTLAPSQ